MSTLTYSPIFFVLIIAIGQAVGSGSTDSATIRTIESEIRRVKANSDGIITEIKKQKDATAALQNEFKWLHNELKSFKKSLSDIEMLLNKTESDTQFIRNKVTDLTTVKQTTTTPAPNNGTSSKPSTIAPKKFILF